MQSEVFETDKSSINNSNVVQDIDAGLSGQPENVVPKEDYQNLIENDEDLENNFTDSDDDQYINSFSSPSNSDDELRWYAYRGRLGINFLEQNDAPNNQLNYPQQNENHQANNHNNIQQNQQQEEEETDFLEMDFEPDTNSEIENDNEGRFNLNYDLRNGHNNLPENHQQLPSQNQLNFHINQSLNELENHTSSIRNTGAKPKQFSSCRSLKSPKQNPQHASDGDNTFKITGHLYPHTESSSSKQQQQLKDEDSYNIGASCSRYSLNSERPYHRPNNLESNYIKPHKSPSKSYSHNHKQQRLHEEQNDQFLFEIEPIKPRNSVTIYTSNCDEKILMDALISLKLKPDREVIMNYFNKSKMVPQLGLIDYIIYRSKKNCNYLKIIELIKNSCVNDYHDEYGTKKFDINFYPLDFFSTTPEMIDIEVSEIVKRWSPQTDLSPLVNIKNKYFIQTNVLGKLVYIVRRLNNNQKLPSSIFREGETIKIPQFFVSGYITITTRHPT